MKIIVLLSIVVLVDSGVLTPSGKNQGIVQGVDQIADETTGVDQDPDTGKSGGQLGIFPQAYLAGEEIIENSSLEPKTKCSLKKTYQGVNSALGTKAGSQDGLLQFVDQDIADPLIGADPNREVQEEGTTVKNTDEIYNP